MQIQSFWKRRALGVTGVLLLVGTVTAYGITRGNFSKIWLGEPSALSGDTQLKGNDMSIGHHEKQAVLHADDATFQNLVLNSTVPVLVDFYADWCGPCQRLGPTLQELAAENPNIRVVKVNVDQSPSLAMEYGIESIPNVKVFRNGRVADEVVGLASKSQLRALLQL